MAGEEEILCDELIPVKEIAERIHERDQAGRCIQRYQRDREHAEQRQKNKRPEIGQEHHRSLGRPIDRIARNRPDDDKKRDRDIVRRQQPEDRVVQQGSMSALDMLKKYREGRQDRDHDDKARQYPTPECAIVPGTLPFLPEGYESCLWHKEATKIA